MGMPAARLTDTHQCTLIPPPGGPILPPCCLTVLTGGLPQARVTDLAACLVPPGTAIALGSLTVLVGGLPAARLGDPTACGGAIALGLPTVLIG
jgi:uncharacterized Zn-binding protein involved in type VI secretion